MYIIEPGGIVTTTSDLVDQSAAPVEPAYAFLNEHSRGTTASGELAETCKTDGETWPCVVARAFFAGRRSGLDIAADRLERLAEGFDVTLGVQRVRQVAAHLKVDADEIDQGLRDARQAVRQCPTCRSPGVRPLYPARCGDSWHDAWEQAHPRADRPASPTT